MSDFTLTVQPRADIGSSASRRLRAAGLVPAVVYGGGKETVAIEVDRKQVIDLLKKTGRENAVFLLKLSSTGQERHTMIRDLDVDPVSRQIRHIDFQRVLMNQKVRVAVPVELVGTPYGVKTEGGLLDFVTRELEVECLPGDIPRHLTFDVTELHVGDHLEAGQVEMPGGVTLAEDPHRVIASLGHSRVAEAEEGAGEALLEAQRDEPQVIKRGRPESE